MTTKKLTTILAIAFTITLLLIIGLAYSPQQKKFIIDQAGFKDTLRFEVLKSLLQLLVIIIIGGIISTLFKATEANREQSKIKMDTWKDCLKRIAQNYQDAKLVRRTLTAGGLTGKYGDAPKLVNKEQVGLYIEQMGILNKVQLELEGLKREAKFLPEYFSLNKISESLGTSEDYLRLILKEYEAFLPRLKNDQPVQFTSLERLNEFTTSTKTKTFEFRNAKEYTDFRFLTHFAETFDDILIVFNGAFE